MKTFYNKTHKRANWIKAHFDLLSVNMEDFVNCCPYPMSLMRSRKTPDDIVDWRHAGFIISYALFLDTNIVADFFNKNRVTIYKAFERLKNEIESPDFGQPITSCINAVIWYSINRPTEPNRHFCKSQNVGKIAPKKVA